MAVKPDSKLSSALQDVVTAVTVESKRRSAAALAACLTSYFAGKDEPELTTKTIPKLNVTTSKGGKWDAFASHLLDRLVNSLCSSSTESRDSALFALCYVLELGKKQGYFIPATFEAVAKELFTKTEQTLTAAGGGDPGELQGLQFGFLFGWNALLHAGYAPNAALSTAAIEQCLAYMRQPHFAVTGGDLAADLLAKLAVNPSLAKVKDAQTALANALATAWRTISRFDSRKNPAPETVSVIIPQAVFLLKIIAVEKTKSPTFSAGVKEALREPIAQFKGLLVKCADLGMYACVAGRVNLATLWPSLFFTAVHVVRATGDEDTKVLEAYMDALFASAPSQNRDSIMCTAELIKRFIEVIVYTKAVHVSSAKTEEVQPVTATSTETLISLIFGNANAQLVLKQVLTIANDVDHQAYDLVCVFVRVIQVLVEGPKNSLNLNSAWYKVFENTRTQLSDVVSKATDGVKVNNEFRIQKKSAMTPHTPFAFLSVYDHVKKLDGNKGDMNAFYGKLYMTPWKLPKEVTLQVNTVISKIGVQLPSTQNKLLKLLQYLFRVRGTPAISNQDAVTIAIRSGQDSASFIAPFKCLVASLSAGSDAEAIVTALQAFASIVDKKGDYTVRLEAPENYASDPAMKNLARLQTVNLMSRLRTCVLSWLKRADHANIYRLVTAATKLAKLPSNEVQPPISKKEESAAVWALVVARLPYLLLRLIERVAGGAPHMFKVDSEDVSNCLATLAADLRRVAALEGSLATGGVNSLLDAVRDSQLAQLPLIDANAAGTRTKEWIDCAQYVRGNYSNLVSLAQQSISVACEAASDLLAPKSLEALWPIILGHEAAGAEAQEEEEEEEEEDGSEEESSSGSDSGEPSDSEVVLDLSEMNAEQPSDDETVQVSSKADLFNVLTNTAEEEAMLNEKREQVVRIRQMNKKGNKIAQVEDYAKRTRVSKVMESIIRRFPQTMNVWAKDLDSALDEINILAVQVAQLSVSTMEHLKKAKNASPSDERGAWSKRSLELWRVCNETCSAIIDALLLMRKDTLQEDQIACHVENAAVLFGELVESCKAGLVLRHNSFDALGVSEMAHMIHWFGRLSDFCATLSASTSSLGDICEAAAPDAESQEAMRACLSVALIPGILLHPVGIHCRRCKKRSTKRPPSCTTCIQRSHGYTAVVLGLQHLIHQHPKTHLCAKLIKELKKIDPSYTDPTMVAFLSHELVNSGPSLFELLGVFAGDQ